MAGFLGDVLGERGAQPGGGRLLEAAAAFSIDLNASYMIGDKMADVEAGLAAGCRPLLVRTGYGEREAISLPAGVSVVDDILAAARQIISEGTR